jgi:hypothetical protein
MILRPRALPFGFELFDKLADFVPLGIAQVLFFTLSLMFPRPR